MGVYRSMTRVLALLTIALGLVIFVSTAVRGGGIGLLLGALFVAAGAGRLWLLRGRT